MDANKKKEGGKLQPLVLSCSNTHASSYLMSHLLLAVACSTSFSPRAEAAPPSGSSTTKSIQPVTNTG
ncbi:hypothetical protein PCASD_21981 [Puccinia coronata f. sp. avenae]|uniref:Uncharacterized protein n=1 Tax=Puccinia coronata f. sp. avenae TaxID=200324 RepID=A0A2N5U3A0_9BASI|nr:hypothetical protein PCASD_21981 [Puccinia coronata f. sp. avenae]